MKKFKICAVFMTLVLVFSSWAPALATTSVNAVPQSADWAATGPVTLTITNPMPKATTVSLTGTKTYNIYVMAGATITKTIDPGKYKYSYPGCFDKVKKGNLNIKGTKAVLKIAQCKMAKWVWMNPSAGNYVTIRLKGWVNYNLTIAPGQIVKVSWVVGTYQVTLTHCGKTYHETWKVSGNRRFLFYPCK